jgi:hypothetical protein
MMMRSSSLFFLLSASVQVSSAKKDFMFDIHTARANPADCNANFRSLGIPLDATFDPAPTYVFEAIDAVIRMCSEAATDNQYGEGVHHVTPGGRLVRRNLLATAAVTSTRQTQVCETLCACQRSICKMTTSTYCSENCNGGNCVCERRLEETFEDANEEGTVQEDAAVETHQRELYNSIMSANIISGCTYALTSLAENLNKENNYCLGYSGKMEFLVEIYS